MTPERLYAFPGVEPMNRARHGDWIQTYTGGRFWPLDPVPAEIHLEDIAHSLSMQCRYTGHSSRYYSVAQHAVYVSRQVEAMRGTLDEQLWGLHHDDEETYTGDMARPIKRLAEMKAFRDAGKPIMRAVAMRFDLLPNMEPDIVRFADNVLLATEVDHLMQYTPEVWSKWIDDYPRYKGWFRPCGPRWAKHMFLRRHWELTRAIGCRDREKDSGAFSAWHLPFQLNFK